MLRSPLTVTPLEDRNAPTTLKFTVTLSLNTPPQDPMDNPPPAQPGGNGSTTPPSPPPPPPTTPPTS